MGYLLMIVGLVILLAFVFFAAAGRGGTGSSDNRAP